jgi:hypothetical protein
VPLTRRRLVSAVRWVVRGKDAGRVDMQAYRRD